MQQIRQHGRRTKTWLINGAMQTTMTDVEAAVVVGLTKEKIAEARDIAWACAWLEACGYPGVQLLAEALEDPRRDLTLTRDALGLDLENVSCVFIAPKILRDVAQNGRAFLRNVRHGLYVLPFSVRENIGIGCPIDPSFALGGNRSKNPYGEKLEAAAAEGLSIDDSIWQRFA
jgi:hypothetical protein